MGLKEEVDHLSFGFLFFFHIAVLLVRPSGAAFLGTGIWGIGGLVVVSIHTVYSNCKEIAWHRTVVQSQPCKLVLK